MATLTEFVVQLVRSVVDLFVIFGTEIATQDPIGLLVFLVGAVITAFSVGFVGYLTVGALLAGLRDIVYRSVARS